MLLNKTNYKNKMNIIEYYRQHPDKQEISLLQKITSLSPELINIIYQYLNGKGKLICHRKYDFLKRHLKGKNDYYNGYPFWNYIRQIIDPMSKPQLIKFLTNTIVDKYPCIIEKFWYYSRDTDKHFHGQKLLDLWCETEVDNYITFKIKERTIHLIYNYILCNIHKFETEKNNNNNKYCNKIFIIIENTFKLYKSLQYISEHKHKQS